MSFHKEQISYQDAVAQIGNYSYALLYNYSEMKLCSAGDITEKDLSECTEARFFRPDGEIHLLTPEEKAVLVTDGDEAHVLTESYKLAERFQFDGKKTVEIRKYLEPDKDGQMRVVLTRRAGLR